MNNTLEGINSRITEAEGWISDLEDRMVEITACHRTEYRKKKKKQGSGGGGDEDSLKDLWDNIKCINICIIGGPRKRRDKGSEKIFEEIIAENFPNMEKEIVNLIQEAQ